MEIMDEKPVLTAKEQGYLLTKPISAENTSENSAIVAFSKPFVFEGTSYTGIDTTCLDKLTGADLTAINTYLNKRGNTAPVKEIDYTFLEFAVAKAADVPVEFFELLPAKEFSKVMRRAQAYFFGED